MIELTVVFPAYNRPDEVHETLRLLKRNLSVEYEVIILDNSPVPLDLELRTNESAVVTGNNLGTGARNIGIEQADSEFILLIDDDSHPFEGTVEKAIKYLEGSPDNVAGVTSRVERPDGGWESPPLLPTAFHGCGVLFRSCVLKKLLPFYPENFCFYGEEYWSTLNLYSKGYTLKYLNGFVICHRMSAVGRDVGRILYHLSVNNRKTWKPFIGDSWIDKIEYDTNRRYELIAAKENVSGAFKRAKSEKLGEIHKIKELTDRQFAELTLLNKFEKLLNKISENDTVVLCGCGKFPTLWADYLVENSRCKVLIIDFNTGLIDKEYGGYRVTSPYVANTDSFGGTKFIVGHTSRCDTEKWKCFCDKNNFGEVLEIDV